ncbi:TPR domain protein, putative component of TonB system [hydrothermal vent metagenome]|uniref:TPR domain protein, putative component of TonB system n=1 Tax=hydrothermal vent metagenome TaxID=652676 RepID=A0A3B0X0M8_9ZZZZ
MFKPDTNTRYKYRFLSLTLILVLFSILLSACKTEDPPTSLADIDVVSKKNKQEKVFIQPKSNEEIREAYTEYLNNADVDDKARIDALNRLAALELTYSNKLLQEQENNEKGITNDALDDELFNTRLNKTIDLITTSLKDYPKSKNNGSLLYQLAKAYDQKGDHQKSMDTLAELIEKFPKNPFYVEAQFRIAEEAFSQQDYNTAEYAYTEVIISRENDIFHEKSLFKRGWSRFKQQYYTEAVDDFLEAVLKHNFDEFEKLNKTEREQFDEYFRAIGLAFSYLGGSEPLYEYFQNRPDFLYTYHTYSMVAEIYLKQERFSDAVDTLQQFIKFYPGSDNIPYSHLKIIEIWKNSGFSHKVYNAIEEFYVEYNPSSEYWKKQNEKSSVNRAIRRSLQEYVVLMTGYYHNKYQKSLRNSDYAKTELWYKRYLKHYRAYAQKDNVYFLYAELLSQKKKNTEALKYYELAAYDNDLIVHKNAAYASIILSDNLATQSIANKAGDKKHLYLKKQIRYALKYAQKYPTDKRTRKLVLHAAELAFKSADYKTAIELSDLIIESKPVDRQASRNNYNYLIDLKAESYFKLKEYAEAESIYKEILKQKLSSQNKIRYRDKLALSIYKQGEQANLNNDAPQAINHYSRISLIVPTSTIATTGLYDAIALNMRHKQWKNAITDIKRFQSLYPRNKLQPDISRKLSVAYLSSDQGIKAAAEFEKIANSGGDIAIKAAALWQAAELYEEKNKLEEAIRSYEEYARKFRKPYVQHMESMNKLTELYQKKGSLKNTLKWQSSIVKADKSALNNIKTDRTKYITSFAYLGLAHKEQTRFNKIRLSLPLKRSLRNKKVTMQRAVKYYGKASKYKLYEPSTESTYAIALIYRNFSKALLESDRPRNLSSEQLDQYEILLEDQAFPFEDKAIEFFEINLSRIKDGRYNSWIKKSHQQLSELFPVRYNRQPKQDRYINVAH